MIQACGIFFIENQIEDPQILFPPKYSLRLDTLLPEKQSHKQTGLTQNIGNQQKLLHERFGTTHTRLEDVEVSPTQRRRAYT